MRKIPFGKEKSNAQEAKSQEVVEEKEEKVVSGPKVIDEKVSEFKLTEYQKNLEKTLHGLEWMIFKRGASRGDTKQIPRCLHSLQELQKVNLEEYDQLINSNSRYKTLTKMFPNWTDPLNIRVYSASEEDGTMSDSEIMKQPKSFSHS